MIRTMLKQSRAICWVAVLLTMAGGCVRSVEPILKDEQVITNDQLLGNWVGDDGKTSGVVTAADNQKRYPLVYTDEHGKESNLLIRLGKIGDMTIAESSIGDPAPDAGDAYKMHLLPMYSFMVIKQATPQRLVLKMMSPDWLSKYVDAHPSELATLKVTHEDFVVTASTEAFQAFLIRHAKNDGAFGDDGIFVRPGDPSTRPTAAPATNTAPPGP